MNQPSIRQLTINAATDNLGPEDYRDIYNELRRQDPEEPGRYAISLDAFIQAIGSQYSKAAWSKYHRAQLDLNRTMRNELRQAVGLAALPPTVQDAMAHLDPNAEVIQVGDDQPRRAVLIGHPEPILLYINGGVQVDEPRAAKKGHVTAVTRPRRGRIAVPMDLYRRLNQRRKQAGLTWSELIARLEDIDLGEKK